MILERQYEINLRNRILGENLSKIQNQQNKYLSYENAKKQVLNKIVLRKLEQDRIKLENSKIGDRITKA